MDKFIVNPAKLKFDPKNDKIKDELKLVFENKLARTLWRGIKQRHLTNQYFEKQCLNVSEIFEKLGIPDTTEKLGRIMSNYFGEGYNNSEFLNELLPYLSGKKDLEYEVVK